MCVKWTRVLYSVVI